jgi:hypothetical protein
MFVIVCAGSRPVPRSLGAVSDLSPDVSPQFAISPTIRACTDAEVRLANITSNAIA